MSGNHGDEQMTFWEEDGEPEFTYEIDIGPVDEELDTEALEDLRSWLDELSKPNCGHILIGEERLRQVVEEGYDAFHDDTHGWDVLTGAARTYLWHALGDEVLAKASWPFIESVPKPTYPHRDLCKAGALIAAAMDTLHRKGLGKRTPKE